MDWAFCFFCLLLIVLVCLELLTLFPEWLILLYVLGKEFIGTESSNELTKLKEENRLETNTNTATVVKILRTLLESHCISFLLLFVLESMLMSASTDKNIGIITPNRSNL